MDWAELSIVSQADVTVVAGSGSIYLGEDEAQQGTPHGIPTISVATGHKCARCWKVLDEVGQDAHHPELCLRCVDVVQGKA